MASRQLFQLTARTLAAADLIVTQDAAGAVEAGKNTVTEAWQIAGYKCYVALVTQSSTSAPSATVIKNDFTVSISWSRTSTGIYVATITSSEFTSAKTITMITNSTNGTGTAGAVWVDANNIQVVTRNFSAAVTDGILTAAALKIEVYP